MALVNRNVAVKFESCVNIHNTTNTTILLGNIKRKRKIEPDRRIAIEFTKIPKKWWKKEEKEWERNGGLDQVIQMIHICCMSIALDTLQMAYQFAHCVCCCCCYFSSFVSLNFSVIVCHLQWISQLSYISFNRQPTNLTLNIPWSNKTGKIILNLCFRLIFVSFSSRLLCMWTTNATRIEKKNTKNRPNLERLLSTHHNSAENSMFYVRNFIVKEFGANIKQVVRFPSQYRTSEHTHNHSIRLMNKGWRPKKNARDLFSLLQVY